ncbi:MAG: dihydrodipicolinate synthase family protein [Verrucomicrobia bacterium]|nr:dihydrodipicolinate synthase family protein [Verrucomicrobiota bacterium]MDA1069296.1 dihydrodipicolinate synthase family protein [Verrucomicrobiota bacterium]
MNLSKLEGILPVLPTPFDEDGNVDISAMEKVTRFCIDAGASALVFPGVASEYDHLSSDEQQELLGVVCRVADGRLPIICGGGNGGPEHIGRNIMRAHELGAVAAMVLIPKEFAGDVDGAQFFIESVIEQAPGVDIILQNAPAPVGAGLEATESSRIVSACPAIRYVKEEALPSGPRISAIQAAAPEHLMGVIGGGGARYLIDEMNRGAIAAMPAAEITDLHVRMWNAYQSGNESEARELYMRTLPLLIIQLLYRMRLTKYVLTRRGIFSNSHVRAPLPDFDEFDQTELGAQLESLSSLFEIAPLKTVDV